MPNHSHSEIIGHAGRDAETRYLPNGDAVTRKRKDKDGGKRNTLNLYANSITGFVKWQKSEDRQEAVE